jgi:hypothetical protein
MATSLSEAGSRRRFSDVSSPVPHSDGTTGRCLHLFGDLLAVLRSQTQGAQLWPALYAFGLAGLFGSYVGGYVEDTTGTYSAVYRRRGRFCRVVVISSVVKSTGRARKSLRRDVLMTTRRTADHRRLKCLGILRAFLFIRALSSRIEVPWQDRIRASIISKTNYRSG